MAIWRHSSSSVVLVIFFALSLLLQYLVSASQGLSGDPCTAEDPSTCRAPRKCMSATLESQEACAAGSSNCACFSSLPIPCNSTTICPAGERCAANPTAQFPLCISCNAIAQFSLTAIGSQACVTAPPLPPQQGPGLTGDPCRSDAADCTGDRLCLLAKGVRLYACTPDLDPECECIPRSGLQTCSASTKCPSGERCAKSTGGIPPSCYGCQRVERDDALFPVDITTECPGASPEFAQADDVEVTQSPAATAHEQDVETPLPHPSSSPPSSPDGQTPPRQTPMNGADFSSSASVSASPSDVDSVDGSIVPTQSPVSVPMPSIAPVQPETPMDEEAEISITPKPGVPSEDASIEPSAEFAHTEVGPTPVAATDSSGDEDGVVSQQEEIKSTPGEEDEAEMSPSVEPSAELEEGAVAESTEAPSTPPEEAVCIAEKHLRHLQRSQLVFTQDRYADVLCDAAGSCATDGHIVMWHKQAMTMRSYCTSERTIICVRRRMLVNSPRFRRGVRVKAHTPGLSFSALAARWGSKGEEVVLRTLVHAGM